MKRRGVAAVVFLNEKGKKKYLILHRKLNWNGWELLKGGCKSFELEYRALKREVFEEIGISDFKFKKTKYVNSFKYQKVFLKDNRFWNGARHTVYLVEVFSKKIKIDKKEHSGFKWVSKKEALKLLTWNDQKKIFNKLAE